MMKLKIVADENIPLLQEAFGEFGTITTYAGRDIGPDEVREADILLVRSVTHVNAALLAQSRVRWVASATAGIDHVEVDWLKAMGIGFAHAPGSNAQSVVEYVLAGLITHAHRTKAVLRGKTAGIVGYGNIGRRLAPRLAALGMSVVVHDPPLVRMQPDAIPYPILGLTELLAASDVVTFHVPLTKLGEDATWHMLNADNINHLKAGVWLVQASRGGVVDEGVVVPARQSGLLGGLILDVWEGEPQPSPMAVQSADIATPHIAGYGYDAKIEGTRMILEAFGAHFGVAVPALPTPSPPNPCQMPASSLPEMERLFRLIQQVYPIQEDDQRFRALLKQPIEARPAYFHQLRKQYPKRYGFEAYRPELGL